MSNKELFRQCDPSTCPECLYLAEGDFACTKHEHALVVEDWIPTDSYLICMDYEMQKSRKLRNIVAICIFTAFLIAYVLGVTVIQEASREANQILIHQPVSDTEALARYQENNAP